MSEIINPKYFKHALDFNEANFERINKACTPLFDAFGIKYFAHIRFLNEGQYVLVSNCAAYIKFVSMYDYNMRSKHLKNHPKFLCKYTNSKYLWPSNKQDELIEGLRSENVQNGFNISREDKGTLDFYFFGSNEESPLLTDLYINNTEILESFISYFDKICGDLNDYSDLSKSGISPNMKKLYPLIENVFLKTTQWERQIDVFNQLLNARISEEIEEMRKKYLITKRELECLSHLTTGKSAKEIATLLNIGHRTVETHLDRLRLKIKCHTKGELMNWFETTFSALFK